MLELKRKISLIFGGVAGGISAFYLGLDLTLRILIGFMFIDLILGFSKAYLDAKVTSNEMYKGAIRKGIIFVIIYIAYQLGNATNIDMVHQATIMYYVSMEALSIFEHAVDFDVPLPTFLKAFAERLNTDADKTEIT